MLHSKRTGAWITALVVLVGALVAGCGEETLTVPDMVGMTVGEARTSLRDSSIYGMPDYVDSTGADAYPIDAWKVAKQSPDAGTAFEYGSEPAIVLTVSDPDPATTAPKVTPTPEQTTTGGLDAAHAQTACDAYADDEFPYGAKMHWIIGRLAEEYLQDSDEWYFKVNTTVTNEYNAERDYDIECYVTGSNEAPQITQFLYY